MILDRLANRAMYQGLHGGIVRALEFLASPQALALEPAAPGGESTRFDIEGDDIFALVQRYRTKSPSHTFWEAHRKYIDVQFVAEGAEMMGWLPLDSTGIVQAYDEARDFVMLEPCAEHQASFMHVARGMFAIFHPHDAHMPGLALNGVEAAVKKIVVKVRA